MECHIFLLTQTDNAIKGYLENYNMFTDSKYDFCLVFVLSQT